MVIDEAAQLAEAYFPIVFLENVERVYLIGDPKQLPAVVSSFDLMKRAFGRSIFERFVSSGWPAHLLQVQYRMHPAISSFPNACFYRSRLVDSDYVQHRATPAWLPDPNKASSSSSSASSASASSAPSAPSIFARPLSVVHLRSLDGEQSDALQSLFNPIEEAATLMLLHRLHALLSSARNCITSPVTVAVIAPYRRQVINIQARLKLEFPEADVSKLLRIETATVDAFQGQERDIVIMTLVRSNAEGTISELFIVCHFDWVLIYLCSSCY